MADEFTKAALYGIKTFNKKAKEKIGIEKLIELLNEYEPYIATDGWRDNLWGYVYQGHSAVFPKEIGMLKIISKEYGFIKRLVDNDKIDKEFEDNKMLGDIFDSGYRFNDDYIEARLLCYLALSDEPIRFLCEILK